MKKSIKTFNPAAIFKTTAKLKQRSNANAKQICYGTRELDAGIGFP